MANRNRETEYMYSSAGIRALETKLVGRERLGQLAEMGTAEEILSALGEYGFSLVKRESDGACLREKTLLGGQEQMLRQIEQMPNTEGLLDFLRYPYDCNNIKTILKSMVRGVDPSAMLFSFGTVAPEELAELLREKRYDALPVAMGRAVDEAMEAFAATGEPGRLDLLMDKACYEDMLSAANEAGIPLGIKLVQTKIDLTNLLCILRLLRMPRAGGQDMLTAAMLSGGRLSEDFFLEALGGDEAALAERLESTPYSSFAEALRTGERFYVLERMADEYYLDVARDAKYVPFGPEVAIGYWVAVEYEIKNLRLLLAGKDAGLSSEVLRERLRD
ncbi:MAG: V-type ATPase subunit [Clostridia bacterium]|nr:V-type ATPase subunit [Clostridia bacterium]